MKKIVTFIGLVILAACTDYLGNFEKEYEGTSWCGGKSYNPEQMYCSSDALKNIYENCGNETFDTREHFCANNELYNLCGGNEFDIDKSFCQDNKVYNKCNGESYDALYKFCFEDNLQDLCNGIAYDLNKEFCYNYTVYPFCNGETYNVQINFCYNNSLWDNCGLSSYDPGTQFCENATIYSKCEGDVYDLSTHFCSSNVLYEKCNGNAYNVSENTCIDGVLTPICGGEIYDSDKYSCQNGTLMDKCGSQSYSTSTAFCDTRNNQLYPIKQIAGHLWMMKNLNWDNGNSLCYNNSSSNCSSYGRMYTGPDAQRVCPTPWRLPDDEFQDLLQYAMSATGVSYYNDTKVINWLKSSFNMELAGVKIPQDFRGFGDRVNYWTSSYNYDGYYHFGILYSSLDQFSDSDKGYYNYVRCVY